MESANTTSVVASEIHVPAWRHPFVLLLVATHFFFLAYFLVNSVFPLYVEDLPKWKIGLAVGAFPLGSVLARPLSGILVDQAGARKTFLALGAAVAAVAVVLMPISNSIAPLIGLRLLFGAGNAFYETASLAILADIAPPVSRGRSVGVYQVTLNSSQVYGPLIGFQILDSSSFGVVFVFGAAVALVSASVAARLAEPARERGVTIGARKRSPWFSPQALLPSALTIPQVLTFGAIFGYLPLLADERSVGGAGPFFVAMGLAVVGTRPLAGITCDRFGRANTAIAGMVASGIAMLLVGLAQNQPLFLSAAVLAGFGHGLSHTGAVTALIDRALAHQRAAATATFSMVIDGGILAASAGLGLVASGVGLTDTYYIVAAMIASFIVAAMAGRRGARFA